MVDGGSDVVGAVGGVTCVGDTGVGAPTTPPAGACVLLLVLLDGGSVGPGKCPGPFDVGLCVVVGKHELSIHTHWLPHARHWACVMAVSLVLTHGREGGALVVVVLFTVGLGWPGVARVDMGVL